MLLKQFITNSCKEVQNSHRPILKYVHQILTCLNQSFQGRPTWSPLLLYMKLDDFYEVKITWIQMACKSMCPANIMHGWMNFSRWFILLCKMNDIQCNVSFRSRKRSKYRVKAVAPFAKCVKSVSSLFCCVVGLRCYTISKKFLMQVLQGSDLYFHLIFNPYAHFKYV